MNPRDVYESRRAARAAEVARLDRFEGWIANGRLALFAATGLVAWLAFWRHALSPFWLLLPGGAFLCLVVAHDRLLDRRARQARAVAFWEQGLARLDGTWPGRGIDGARFDDPDHPYCRDLDLFGSGSLFERLCVARTAAGEETLASWLLHPAPPAVVAARQEAVRELSDRLDLREEVAVLGADVRARVDPGRLASWGEGPAILPGKGPWIAAACLTASGIGAAVAWPLGAGPLPLLLVALLDLALLRWLRDRLARVGAAVEKPGRDLSVLSLVLARFEREPVEAALLRELRASLGAGRDAASSRIAVLARRIEMLQAQRNQFFAPIAFFLLWPVHLGYAIEAWRAAHGREIARWLAAIGELEALSSLASYAFENPDDPFPAVEEGPARFEGEGIAHPLLRDAVANDVRLGGDHPRALVVSGSNMSGKSTLLRTVGVCAVLAQAGAPVRARSLRLSPLAVGGTLRVQDSLQEGTSRFYAELTRLKQLVEIAEGPLPLLFLVDEIFHGTNSHDRRIGAEAILRGLLDRKAIGLLTTHDLALAEAAEALAPHAANVHFEDRLVDGRLVFDYRMRPGVVQRSNALELMRLVGLPV